MPLYDFVCSKCGAVSEELAPSGVDTWACDCGWVKTRRFTPTTRTHVPAHMQASFPGHDDHSRWFHSDETQAKLKSGAYEIVKPDRYGR